MRGPCPYCTYEFVDANGEASAMQPAGCSDSFVSTEAMARSRAEARGRGAMHAVEMCAWRGRPSLAISPKTGAVVVAFPVFLVSSVSSYLLMD